MARTPDLAKRAELLRGVVGYLEERGVADLSLAPLATALGTTKRMLLYYFGDREALLSEALATSRPDVGRMFASADDRDGLRAAAHSLWTAISEGGQHRSIRMLLQILSLAPSQPETYGEFAVTAVQVMVDPIADAFSQAGFPGDESRARATLVVSGLRGLCQDLMVTGDSTRVNAAADALITAATAPSQQ